MRPNKRPYYYSCSRLTKKCFLSCSVRSACLISMDLLVCFNSLLWVRSGTCPGCDPRFLRKAGPQLGLAQLPVGLLLPCSSAEAKEDPWKPLQTWAYRPAPTTLGPVRSPQQQPICAKIRREPLHPIRRISTALTSHKAPQAR